MSRVEVVKRRWRAGAGWKADVRGRWWRARMLLLIALRAGVGGDERQLLALPGPSAGGVLRLHSDAAASKTATRTNSLRASAAWLNDCGAPAPGSSTPSNSKTCDTAAAATVMPTTPSSRPAPGRPSARTSGEFSGPRFASSNPSKAPSSSHGKSSAFRCRRPLPAGEISHARVLTIASQRSPALRRHSAAADIVYWGRSY